MRGVTRRQQRCYSFVNRTVPGSRKARHSEKRAAEELRFIVVVVCLRKRCGQLFELLVAPGLKFLGIYIFERKEPSGIIANNLGVYEGSNEEVDALFRR